jgi:dTMP kinase
MQKEKFEKEGKERHAFIVFDGIDGSGKSTIARKIAKYLKSKGLKVFLTHEPSNFASGKKIRELVRKKSSQKLSRKFWIALFTQDRLEHINKFILPKLKEGIVISDRYYYSTLAYQMKENEWQEYLKKYRFLKPDMAFILDVNPKIALQRVEKAKPSKAVFEKERFLEKVRKRYVRLCKLKNLLKENLFLIDANQPMLKVFADVKKFIDKELK